MIAIKQSAQNSFYEALGTLKVSIYECITRIYNCQYPQFNGTSPVRSLQLIDGVDNQSPGLNFSLGNFLGSSELDVLKVDLIAGASSAYYGPNAFNGVIAMTTRSPFVKPGLEVSFKVGERNLVETAVRWSQVFKDKSGNERFAYKLNLFYMKANDWQANNMSATPDSPDGPGNPGGYDAVNVYGDEYYATSNYNSVPRIRPGVMTYYRTGYAENDLVDYNTENFKSSLALHYKTKSKNEIIFNSAFGAGTTVYQGDNRFSLKDILFFQNRIEYREENKFFIRAYTTNEDAGKSYDAYFTALLLQQASKSDYVWSTNYVGFGLCHRIDILSGKQFSRYPQAPSPSDRITISYLLNILHQLIHFCWLIIMIHFSSIIIILVNMQMILPVFLKKQFRFTSLEHNDSIHSSMSLHPADHLQKEDQGSMISRDWYTFKVSINLLRSLEM